MSQMQINQVLAQIRSALSHGRSRRVPWPGAPGARRQCRNGRRLRRSCSSRASMRSTAASRRGHALADAFERGVDGVDLAQVMLESQKASVSFRALTEVRNRLVNVYQDIMNMPI